MASQTEMKIYKDYIHKSYTDYANTYFSKVIYCIAEKGDLTEFTRNMFLFQNKKTPFPLVSEAILKNYCSREVLQKYVLATSEYRRFENNSENKGKEFLLDTFFKQSPFKDKNPGASNFLRGQFFDAWVRELSDELKKIRLKNIIYEHIDLAGYLKILQFNRQYGYTFKNNLKKTYPNINQDVMQKALDNRNKYIGHENNSVYTNMTPDICASTINDVYNAVKLIHNDNDPEGLQEIYKGVQKYFDNVIESLKNPPLSLDAVNKRFPEVTVEMIKGSNICNKYDPETQTFYFTSIQDIKSISQTYTDFSEKSNATARQEEREKYEAEIDDIRSENEKQHEHIRTTIKTYLKDLILNLEKENIFSSEEINQYLDNDTDTNHADDENVDLTSLPRLKLMEEYHGGHLKDDQLAELARETVFFTDISAWMDSDSRSFIANKLVPLLKGYNKKLFIDWSMRVELYDIETNRDHKYTEAQVLQAHKARIMMHMLHQRGFIRYNDAEKNQYRTSFDAIVDVANTMKNKRFTILAYGKDTMDRYVESTDKNCLVITSILKKTAKVRMGVTMDRAMSFIDPAINEIPVNISEQSDEPENEIEVEKTQDPEEMQKEEKKKVSSDHQVFSTPKENKKEQLNKEEYKKKIRKAFKAGTKCIKEDEKLLPLSEIIEKGSTAYKEDGSAVQVDDKIAEGGEGIIYHTSSSGLVAKIYKREKLTKNRYDKLSLMIHNNPHISQLCWPTDLLFNKNKEFVGYLMPELQPNYKEFGRSVLQLQKDAVRKDENLGMKDWNRKTLVKLCLDLSNVMNRIHSMNIIIGDINPKNFMIDPKRTNKLDFKIVDCDSFQVASYPCPVGTQAYTSPEIYKRLDTDSPRFGEFLRTLEDEEYAFASLLFRILMLGQSPSASKGETDINRSIRNYNFAYRTDGEGGEDTPDGPYRLMWNNTPKYIKDSFKQVFTGKGVINDLKWSNLFKKYLDAIDQGVFTAELKPNRYWDNKERSYTRDFTCQACGVETNMPVERYKAKTEQNLPLLCNDCQKILDGMRNTPATVRCSVCHRIIYNPAGRQTKYWESIQSDFKIEVLCASCYNKYKKR